MSADRPVPGPWPATDAGPRPSTLRVVHVYPNLLGTYGDAGNAIVLRARAAVTARECARPEYADCWDVYPFNSGYFMCLRLKDADADAVRVRLLDDHGVGTIALGTRDLRIAFSCLAEAQIPGVFSAVAKAVRAVRGK